MSKIVTFQVTDRPGVLDTIAGLIRRSGVNIRTITAGYTMDGTTQITIYLDGKPNMQKLSMHFDQLPYIKKWGLSTPETHFIRDCLIMRMTREQWAQLKSDGVHVSEDNGQELYAHYVASPSEVESMLKKMRQAGVECSHTGIITLEKEKE